jgi:cell cycle arrest protein BUB3
VVSLWDWGAKKRLTQYPPYASSISALSFSRDGGLLAIGVSYNYDEGPAREHPADAIVVRSVADSDVRPKARA